MQFHIDNMTCGGCARSVKAAIQSVDPEAEIVTDPPSRRVNVRTNANQDQLVAALREAGFPPRGD